MPSSDSRCAGGSRITTYIVVDILPQPASADGIVTAKHLHFRIKQEEIDLPVAQQWHLSDRRTPRVHEILHVRYEFLFLRAGLPLASPYYRRRWPTNARYHNVRTRRGTFRRGRNGSFTFITRFTGRCAALFAFPPRPSFQFRC